MSKAAIHPECCRYCDRLENGRCQVHGEIPAGITDCADRTVNGRPTRRRPESVGQSQEALK